MKRNPIEQYFHSLKPSEKSYLERVQNRTALWLPQSKVQWKALLCQADELYFGGGAGGGKMLDINTPIPTPDGWKLMGSIRPGDIVFDESGNLTTVTWVSGIDESPESYRITFDDGSTMNACADHQWLTFNASELKKLTRRNPAHRAQRRATRASRVTGNRSKEFTENLIKKNKENPPPTLPAPAGSIRTTKEIAETLTIRAGRINHAIPVSSALQLPDANFIVPPFTLGAWLGDGSKRDGKIYCDKNDGCILERIRQDGFSVTNIPSAPIGWTIRKLKPLLREIGVLGDKHIPEAYLRASRDQRLELLRGLMDTDGTVCDSGSVEFTNTNLAIARGVAELIVSLGWKARMREGRAALYGKDCGPVYDIKWTPSDYVFNMPRKRNKQKLSTRRTTKFRYIINCEKIDSLPMRCITVDSPSSLYLAGESMIPTHNTNLLIGMAVELHQHTAIFRRTYPNLTEIIRETRGILEGYARENRMEHTWTYPDGRTIEFGAVQYEDDKKKWQGRAHDLKSFDEITEFTQSQYEFISGWNRTADAGQRVRVIVTGNPPVDEGGSWVKQRWGAWVDDRHPHPAQDGELRWYATVDGKEQECDGGGMFVHKGEKIFPRSRTFIRAMLKDNIFYAQDNRYLSVLQSLPEELRGPLLNGNFNASTPPDPFQIIPTEHVRMAQRRWLEREKPLDILLSAVGVDPSRGGRDKTAVAKRYGNWFSVVSWPGSVAVDGPAVAELVRKHIGEENPVEINLDANGIGSSVYDSLVGMYPPSVVHAFNAADASNYMDKSRKLKMRNKRAEMYWRMRDALDPKSGEDLALPPDTELLADLCSAHYKLTASGVLVEEKENIKERIGRSPDIGEAVMFAYMGGLTKPQLF